ncbi:hypothetical protein FTUN_8008 [Frigoriglobus tundricola]|uniref:Uncharacterized protein n=1 Tax=Frigoriglobus tundricola TaxID=2774151 RepID=A0A6M5Z2C8_9BACT|nr:hypothetical protein FTUN_8008 [Frigoriglobus tundricola]
MRNEYGQVKWRSGAERVDETTGTGLPEHAGFAIRTK